MSTSDSGLPPGDGPQPDLDSRSAGILRVPARPIYLALVGNVVRWFASQTGLSEERCEELELAVDEACTNVIRYAFAEAPDGEMTLVFSPSDAGLEVTVQDRGTPFDPRQGKRIAEEKRLRDPASGGRGLLLIEHFTDAVRYCWDEEVGNRFTLVKHK
jgi:serine/threonine-protein kinase RsbW